MKINTCNLLIKTDKDISQESNKLRGYIGNKFKNHPLLHNHYGNEKFLYSYPLVQYHIFDGQAMIFGIEEGVDALKDISSDLKELKLDNTYYSIEEKIIREKEVDVNTSNDEYHYKFITPWLALNTHNFKKYNNLDDWKEKKLFLNKILIGNILSMAKGLGIIVNRRIYVKTHLEPVSVNYKSVKMLGFTGEFKVRFKIPDYFGFGKGVSHGFGSVKQIIDE